MPVIGISNTSQTTRHNSTSTQSISFNCLNFNGIDPNPNLNDCQLSRCVFFQLVQRNQKGCYSRNMCGCEWASLWESTSGTAHILFSPADSPLVQQSEQMWLPKLSVSEGGRHVGVSACLCCELGIMNSWMCNVWDCVLDHGGSWLNWIHV